LSSPVSSLGIATLAGVIGGWSPASVPLCGLIGND